MLIIPPREKDLGGFSVKRLLPYHKRRMVGPWIFFDHFGPADFPAGEGIDVRPHPHIGLATVTYLFEGEIMHRDSLGYEQAIAPGAINLMVAGRGIVHSERTSNAKRASGQHMHGLQLWLALPEEQERCEPSFTHYAEDTLPTATIDGVPVRVMMGEGYGMTSPVTCPSPTFYAEAKLQTGQSLKLPEEIREKAVYIVSGHAQMENEKLPECSFTIPEDHNDAILSATKDTQIAIIGGDPVGSRLIWWNFVATTQDMLDEAKGRWANGGFDRIPGDDEYIPLPEE